MTDNVWVPRELLLELRDSAYVEAQHYHAAMKGYLQHEHDRLDRIVADADALLAQPVASEPVAFVGGDEVQRFMTWAPDKPAFIHPIGTPLYVSPPALAIQDLIALDRQYIAGFSAGWNAGVTGDEDTKRLAINGRLAEIHAVLAAPQPTEGSTDE